MVMGVPARAGSGVASKRHAVAAAGEVSRIPVGPDSIFSSSRWASGHIRTGWNHEPGTAGSPNKAVAKLAASALCRGCSVFAGGAGDPGTGPVDEIMVGVAGRLEAWAP